MAFNFGFALGTKRPSQNSDNTGLFSKNVDTQKQCSLFGAPKDNAQNITFSSSLFGNDNKTSNENTPTNLFGAPMEQKDTKKENENAQNNLFGAPRKQKDTKKENENISTNLFPFGNQTNEKKSNFLFENPQNKNDTSQNKQDPVFKPPSSLFGNFADENNNNKPQTFSFLGFSQEKENEEKNKKDENEKKNKNNQKEEYVEVKTDEDYKLMLERINSNEIKDNSILIETDRLCGEISRMNPETFEEEIQCVIESELDAAFERIKKYLSGNKKCTPTSQNPKKKECARCGKIINGKIFRSVIDINEQIYCEKCSYLNKEPVFIIQ